MITAAIAVVLTVSGALGAISQKPVTKAKFTATTSETFNAATGNFTGDGKVTFRGGGRKAPFNAHAQGQVTSPGTMGLSGNTFTVSGRVSKGTFITTPAKKGANWFGKGPGTFVARDGSQQDITTGNGTDSGLVLVTFKKRGTLCAQFTEHFMGAASATGSFSTLGGTGAASRFAATGQFASVLSGPSYSTQTNGTARILKLPKGLTAACQQLQGL